MAHPDDLLHDLEVDAVVLDLRVDLLTIDIDAVAERLDRLEAEVADLRRQVARRRWRWWR